MSCPAHTNISAASWRLLSTAQFHVSGVSNIFNASGGANAWTQQLSVTVTPYEDASPPSNYNFSVYFFSGSYPASVTVIALELPIRWLPFGIPKSQFYASPDLGVLQYFSPGQTVTYSFGVVNQDTTGHMTAGNTYLESAVLISTTGTQIGNLIWNQYWRGPNHGTGFVSHNAFGFL